MRKTIFFVLFIAISIIFEVNISDAQKALELDGVDDYLDVGDNASFQFGKEDFSIEQIACFPKNIVEKSKGNKNDFRFKKKKHSKFIIYEKNKGWLKKEIS